MIQSRHNENGVWHPIRHHNRFLGVFATCFSGLQTQKQPVSHMIYAKNGRFCAFFGLTYPFHGEKWILSWLYSFFGFRIGTVFGTEKKIERFIVIENAEDAKVTRTTTTLYWL